MASSRSMSVFQHSNTASAELPTRIFVHHQDTSHPMENHHERPPEKQPADPQQQQQQPPPHQHQQQQQPRPYKPSHWPGIRILQTPKGVHSVRPDERCFTYCTQTIAGRIANQEPRCRSICIRKVFGHEVRNIAPFKSHRSVQQNGEAKYPLPPEGHRLHEILGTGLGDEPIIKDEKHWKEGWYVWFSKSRWAALERLDLMSFDLERQTQWLEAKERRKRVWEEWQSKQRGRVNQHSKHDIEQEPTLDAEEDDHLVQPPRPYPETADQSLLMHLPPPLFAPIYQQVQHLLAPTQHALGLLRESFETGTQQRLAVLAWHKAWTDEPFKLAGNVCGRMWERWKEGPPDDPDGKDRS